jgi:diguanylate cyclase (GGDEF)-like protein
MDLDDFKFINDNFGHEEGDNLLRAVAERMRACMRSGDTLSRRSGDEFVLILENIENKEMVLQVMEKIKSAFEEKFYIKQTERKIGVSIGYAIFPDDAVQQDKLLDLADKRMYQNKN